MRETSLKAGRMMVLDVVCEQDGFSFVNAQGEHLLDNPVQEEER